jgi:hypothetical protein
MSTEGLSEACNREDIHVRNELITEYLGTVCSEITELHVKW